MSLVSAAASLAHLRSIGSLNRLTWEKLPCTALLHPVTSLLFGFCCCLLFLNGLKSLGLKQFTLTVYFSAKTKITALRRHSDQVFAKRKRIIFLCNVIVSEQGTFVSPHKCPQVNHMKYTIHTHTHTVDIILLARRHQITLPWLH